MKGLWQKLMAPRRLEYLEVDANFLIKEASIGVYRFADSGENPDIGTDVRREFPELIGVEYILRAVLEEKQPNFQLKGIARLREPHSLLYFDLYCIADDSQPDVHPQTGLIILLEDATERMAMEQELGQVAKEATLLSHALVAANDYIDKIITSMADALIVTDSTGKIKTTNAAAQKLFGYTAVELRVSNISHIIEDHQLWPVQMAMGSGCTELVRDVEAVCQMKSGARLFVSFSCAAIQSDSEAIQDLVYIGRDITERKRSEEKLRLAMEKERELMDLKNRFVSMTSHEFRTPLSTIISSADLLEFYCEKYKDEKLITHISRIQNSVNQMTQLLDDVLILGKAEAGKLEFKPDWLDVEDFCRDLVAEFEINLAGDRQIDFVAESQNTIAYMDRKLLRHILSNLVANALKYSPAGTPVLFNLIYGAGEVIFLVQDWGIGIPLSDQPRIFDSFHRGTNAGNIPGTGLGMAIVKQCVELHGGRISFVSEVGVGTQFRVVIPFKVQPLPEI
ncbi:MAG TPA: PAS domain S-box protein [Oscillatoriaceae cyanobacterium M33_DOE_052]|uniref:histidine kinase n=1 Tax=Planktothricoides sp. SpSt-374 TaxID=2282167 RepID=A0A7C3ZLP0_9CYAN|nr:PAS domain S-box protein [Oscillatoriaceae cyanobacterium M33_DOE_052]